jgi:hypothetical protein
MTDEEALQFWLETYDRPGDIDQAERAYKRAELNGFRSNSEDYYVSRGIAQESERPRMRAEHKAELLKDIENAKLWHQHSNWELVLDHTVTDQATLNQDKVGDYDEYPFADHAAEEYLAQEIKHKQYTPGQDYYQFTVPFRVRIFYRQNSDYEIAFVFTDPISDNPIAISQRED